MCSFSFGKKRNQKETFKSARSRREATHEDESSAKWQGANGNAEQFAQLEILRARREQAQRDSRHETTFRFLFL